MAAWAAIGCTLGSNQGEGDSLGRPGSLGGILVGDILVGRDIGMGIPSWYCREGVVQFAFAGQVVFGEGEEQEQAGW